MTDYYLKYLKYKQKYTNLKQQLGGEKPKEGKYADTPKEELYDLYIDFTKKKVCKDSKDKNDCEKSIEKQRDKCFKYEDYYNKFKLATNCLSAQYFIDKKCTNIEPTNNNCKEAMIKKIHDCNTIYNLDGCVKNPEQIYSKLIHTSTNTKQSDPTYSTISKEPIYGEYNKYENPYKYDKISPKPKPYHIYEEIIDPPNNKKGEYIQIIPEPPISKKIDELYDEPPKNLIDQTHVKMTKSNSSPKK
jgi:hypothetical protein